MPGPRLPVVNGDKFVMVGDSITSISYSATNYWWKDLRAAVDSQLSVTWVDSGVAGQTAAYFDSHVNDAVIVHAPSKMIVMLGINDAGLNIPPMTFRASLDSFLSASLAALPALKIMLAGPWLNGAARPSGSNFIDGQIDGIRDQMLDCAADRGLPYVDFRALYFASSVNGLTDDGVHPNAAGMQWLSSQALTQVSFGEIPSDPSYGDSG